MEPFCPPGLLNPQTALVQVPARVRGNPCVLTNGSELYWAGSQLYPPPIGERLLVSWQSGVPAPRRSGFVWVLGGGPRCRGPRWRLASGRGSGITGPERGEGLCVECGPRRPRPRPLLSPFQPRAPLESHPAPPPPGWPSAPLSPDFSLPHPHSDGLTSDPYSLPSRPTSSVILSRPILKPPNPTLPRASSVSVRVHKRRGLRSHQVGFYQPLF